MVDIQTVSIAIASASVVAGVIYYSFQIRHQNLQIQHQTKIRETDLILRLQSDWRSKELRESYRTVMRMKFRDYDEYAKKEMDSPEVRAVFDICSFFDGIGILLHRKLIDIDMVDEIFSFYVKVAWEKVKPLIEGRRRELEFGAEFRKWFEYLYDEMQKREQQLASKTA
jgi:hypothetical protein